jgi:chromosome segregation ATPase
MQRKILEDLGLSKEAIDRIMAENGHDVENARKSEQDRFATERTSLTDRATELQSQLDQRATDLKQVQEQLTAAQADAGQLSQLTGQLSSLQAKYDTERQEWAQRQQQQAYEFAVKTATGALKFSSAAAKRDFERGAIDKALKMEGDKILGFDDYVKAYQEADPGAFVQPAEPTPNEPTPTIVLPKGNPTGPEPGAFGFQFHGVRPAPKE